MSEDIAIVAMRLREQGLSNADIARELTKRGYESPQGSALRGEHIARLIGRVKPDASTKPAKVYELPIPLLTPVWNEDHRGFDFVMTTQSPEEYEERRIRMLNWQADTLRRLNKDMEGPFRFYDPKTYVEDARVKFTFDAGLSVGDYDKAVASQRIGYLGLAAHDKWDEGADLIIAEMCKHVQKDGKALLDAIPEGACPAVKGQLQRVFHGLCRELALQRQANASLRQKVAALEEAAKPRPTARERQLEQGKRQIKTDVQAQAEALDALEAHQDALSERAIGRSSTIAGV